MPELPEVETMRRGILGIVGAEVVQAQRLPCKRRPIAISPRIDRLNKRIADQKVIAIDRLGKRVVVVFANQDRLIFEPRMTGLVLVAEPPTEDHLRFELALRNCQHERILYWDRRGLGLVTLLNAGEYQDKLTNGKLGPDAMVVTAAEFAERFHNTKQPVKVALLNQKRVLGIGNLYASEILHMARVNPKTKCDRISRKRWQRVHECMLSVLETAIKYEGSTLSDGTYRNALNKAGGYQNEHQVYDREGEACSTCGTAITRIVQAQRSTFYCQKCQRS